jgi:hypothetical protein
MFLRQSLRLALVFFCAPSFVFAGTKPCVTIDQATKLLNKDVCVEAHVYDVVELPNGTRYLDVCTPQTPDDACQFTIVSLREDRHEVGELTRYRDMNVHIRGIVQSMHGRSGIFLSHSRQFKGGPPKFRPNPKLARGFTADEGRPPISDPSLRAHGGRRAFMNTRDQETLPAN